MVRLLDANVLIALAWPVHIHHQAARRWFASQRDLGWATCSFTEAAFVRLSSNPRVFASAATVADVLQALQVLRALPGHEFLTDQFSLTDSPFRPLIVHHQQVTDAHLLTLAHGSGGRLVTFDRGMTRLLPPSIAAAEVLEVLTA